jgi:hypothetical protein
MNYTKFALEYKFYRTINLICYNALMAGERTPRRLTRDYLDTRVSLKAAGRLGYGKEPRTTVVNTILDVFQARTAARMRELAQEADGQLNRRRAVEGLETGLAGADQTLPEDIQIRPFKPEVVGELIRARIPGHTYLEAIATICGTIINELYLANFDDRRTETISDF